MTDAAAARDHLICINSLLLLLATLRAVVSHRIHLFLTEIDVPVELELEVAAPQGASGFPMDILWQKSSSRHLVISTGHKFFTEAGGRHPSICTGPVPCKAALMIFQIIFGTPCRFWAYIPRNTVPKWYDSEWSKVLII